MLAAGASLLLPACRSSQQLLEPTLSLQIRKPRPTFINDIKMGSNNTRIELENTVKVDKTSVPRPLAAVPSELQCKYSSMLGVTPTQLHNRSLYDFIEEWYGVHYKMGGNDKDGIDCSAFVQKLYEDVFSTNLVRTAREQFRFCRMVFDKETLKEGDLVFFKTKGRKRITHVGVYLANNFFVHASSTQGVTISSLNERYWERYFAGAGKIPVTDSKDQP